MIGTAAIEFSVNLPAGPLSGMAAVASAAESAGFAAVRVGDTQSTNRELYTTLAVIAAGTSSVRLGPGVTNPVTRHPVVTASAIATLHEFSRGRAVLGIGTGDSALRNAGGRPATVAELEAYIRAVRELHETGRTRFHGAELVLEWWQHARVPVIVSAHGPRTLELAGRIADGVVVGLGVGPLAREFAAEHIARGAKAAGRDPSELEVWHLAYLDVAETVEAGARASASALAVGGNLLTRSAARNVIPTALRSAFDELGARYSYVHHAGGGDGSPNARLVEELGLLDFLAEQFGVFGGASDIDARLAALARDGVARIWGAYVQRDIIDFFGRWGARA